MDKDLKSFVIERLAALDLGPIEVVTQSGIDMDRAFVRDILEGKKKSIRPESIGPLAAVLRVEPEELARIVMGNKAAPAARRPDFLPYAGKTQAGVFVDVEVHANESDQIVMIRPDPRYLRAKQYVWQVLGDSMDKAGILDGMYATGVDYHDFIEYYRPIETGDIVVVERLRFSGQERERTIKRYWQERDGITLLPDSTNKNHKPIHMPKDASFEDLEIRIIAYVTGAFNLFGQAIYDLDEGQKIRA